MGVAQLQGTEGLFEKRAPIKKPDGTQKIMQISLVGGVLRKQIFGIGKKFFWKRGGSVGKNPLRGKQLKEGKRSENLVKALGAGQKSPGKKKIFPIKEKAPPWEGKGVFPK